MNKSEKPEFAIVITALAATFRQEPSEALLLGYWMGLEDLDLDAVKQAAARAMRTSRFLPTVAELRELAGELLPATRAILAWEAFRKAVVHHGCYESVDFDDRAINATVANLGGWVPVLERMEAEGNTWVRKDFERVYIALIESGVGAEQGAPLIGICEQSNRFLGYADAVGPPQKVLTGLPAHRPGVFGPAEATGQAPVTLLEGIGTPVGEESSQ